MYDEDRLTALEMYENMFRDAVDEQALLQLLVSPTRQAVIIARAYNAKERKLQIRSQSGLDAQVLNSELPDFVEAIIAVQEEAVRREVIVSGVDENQFSMFGDEEDAEVAVSEAAPEAAADELNGCGTDYAEVPPAAEEPAAEAEALPVSELPAAEETEPAGEIADDVSFPNLEDFVPAVAAAAVTAGVLPLREGPEDIFEPGPDAADELPGVFDDEAPAGIAPEEVLPVGEIADDADVPVLPEDVPVQEVPAEEPAAHAESAVPAPVRTKRTPEEKRAAVSQQKADRFFNQRTVRVAKPIPMALYIMAAIVIIPLVTVLLLIPAFLSLGISLSFIALGAIAVSSAFSSFSIIADVLVVLGCSLVLLALGLLFLWLFIWFIGCAIVGFINSVIQLGSKVCFKEVLVDKDEKEEQK